MADEVKKRCAAQFEDYEWNALGRDAVYESNADGRCNYLQRLFEEFVNLNK